MSIAINEYTAMEACSSKLTTEHLELLASLQALAKAESKSHRERLEAKKELMYLQKEMAQYEL